MERLPVRVLAVLTALLLASVLLYGLWSSADTEIPPPARLVQVAPPPGPDRHAIETTRATSESTPESTVNAEILEWYAELERGVAAVEEHCGVRGMTVACEGAVCSLRQPPIPTNSVLHQLYRKPQLVAERLMVFGMGLPTSVSPCLEAAVRIPPDSGNWVSAPRAVIDQQVPACFVITHETGPEPEGVDAAYAAARLCNHLAADAGTPEAGTYHVSPRIEALVQGEERPPGR